MATAPLGAVTVILESGDPGAATVSPEALAFMAADWATGQDGDGDRRAGRRRGQRDDHRRARGVGRQLRRGDLGAIAVIVTDDDTAGLAFAPAAVTVAQGATAAWTLTLATAARAR